MEIDSAPSTPISPIRSINIINEDHKYAIGESIYEQAAEEEIKLVDKSWLIHEFIDTAVMVSIVLRPRRFGKTMNLTMMEYFFQYMVGEKAVEKRLQAFGKTLISKSPHYKTYMGKYLVLCLSLKDIYAPTAERLEESVYLRFRASIEDCASTSGLQIGADIARVCDTYKLDATKPLMNLLCESASKKFGNEIEFIALIDEYDSPQHVAFNEGFAEAGDLIMKGFFSALLKDNETLHKAFCVGIMPMAKSGIMAGFNNVHVFDAVIPNATYADSFGFTKEEVLALCPNTDGFTFGPPLLDIRPWEEDEIAPDERLEKFYGGYTIAGKTGLYNPWNIVNCVVYKRFWNYWDMSGSSDLLHELLWTNPTLFPVLQVCRDLISKPAGIPITLYLQQCLQYISLHGAIQPKTLWILLLYTGYLTVESIGTSTAVVKIPNQEVRDVWRTWFLQPYSKDYQMSRPYDMMEYLHCGDRVQFEYLLAKFLQLISCYDKKEDNGPLYQVYILGISCHLSQKGWQVDFNEESGLGRLDMRLQKDGHDKAIILEFKYINDHEKEDLAEETAAMGLTQIAQKKYGDKLRRDVKLVQLAGICFHKGIAHCKYGSAERDLSGEWEYFDDNGVSLKT